MSFQTFSWLSSRSQRRNAGIIATLHHIWCSNMLLWCGIPIVRLVRQVFAFAERPSYWLLIYRSYGWRQCSNQDIVFPWHQESIVFKMYYYLFIFNYVCMYIWMQVPTRPEMSDPLVVELQVIVNYPMGALGMELKPSSRAVCTLNTQLLLLPPRSAFNK